MTEQAIYFDGNGYVNNRGVKSRYWGVTTNLNGENKTDRWIVSVHPTDMDCTQSYFSQDFELDEIAAARVAAYMYELGAIKRIIDPTTNIPSVCGRWVYRVRPQERRIIRMKFRRNMELYQFTGKRPLNVLEMAGAAEVRPPESIRKRPKKETGKIESITNQPPIVVDVEKPAIYKEAKAMTTKEVNDTSFNMMCKILDGMKMEPHQARTMIAILKSKI